MAEPTRTQPPWKSDLKNNLENKELLIEKSVQKGDTRVSVGRGWGNVSKPYMSPNYAETDLHGASEIDVPWEAL